MQLLLLFAGAMQWCWMFEITAIFHSIKIVKLLLLFMYGSFIFITFFDIDVSCYVNRIWKNIVKKGPNVYCISNRCTIKSVTNSGSLKPQYSKQVRQTLFVHYRIIHYPPWFTISNHNVICLANPQNGSWVLFTISQNSLYWGSLYRGLSVFSNSGTF